MGKFPLSTLLGQRDRLSPFPQRKEAKERHFWSSLCFYRLGFSFVFNLNNPIKQIPTPILTDVPLRGEKLFKGRASTLNLTPHCGA